MCVVTNWQYPQANTNDSKNRNSILTAIVKTMIKQFILFSPELNSE